MAALNQVVGIISDFNCDWFARILQADQAQPQLTPFLFPFGQVHQSLAIVPEEIEYAFIWTRPQSLFTNFTKAMTFCKFNRTDLMIEVRQFVQKILDFSHHLKFCFVATWNNEEMGRSGGLLNWDAKFGLNYLNAEINLLLAQELTRSKNVALLDSTTWIKTAGMNAYNPKLYYSTKMPYSNAVLESVVCDLKAAIQAVNNQTKKLIIVDLDDTLWGGVVGDVGQENLILGGQHIQGEAFVDFQRALKILQNRGIQLAIVSKNNESIALAAIDNHPCMQLRHNDFVTWRINLLDKAENILEIAREINLGLDAIIFIDNDRVERERVKAALPDVYVPEWPKDPLLYAQTLQRLTCFDQYTLTSEDLNRTRLYASEKSRKQLFASAQTIEEWLADLNMHVTVENMHELNIVRIVQLFNKTNQMNLSTRRFTANALTKWLENSNHSLWAFYMNDKFGDYGLMGVITLNGAGKTAIIEDFILSCRVMGRGMEQYMLAFACEQARLLHANTIIATYLPTPKNSPCLTFMQSSGWGETKEYLFQWDIATTYPMPKHIQIREKEVERIT